MFVRHAFYSTITKGPSVQLVFGFEVSFLQLVFFMLADYYLYTKFLVQLKYNSIGVPCVYEKNMIKEIDSAHHNLGLFI